MSRSDRRTAWIYAFSLVGICLWLALIFLAPYLQSRSSHLGRWLYFMFSPTCHQAPSRCFFLWDFPLAVCARCVGIYFGFLGGTLLYPWIRGFKSLSLPHLRTFLLFSLPMVIDAFGNILRLWSSAGWLRMVLGLIWGAILPFYFITGMADALNKARPH